jgi:hypothetical protein
MDLTREEINELFEKLVHIGNGIESKIKALPGVYRYTQPNQPPTYNGNLMIDIDDYQAVTLDISKIPKGMSKYAYLDKCRDLVQKDLIDQIKKDQGNNKTFLLFTRPRIEANPAAFRIRLEGKWVEEANVPQIDAPEEFEDPFPCS